MMLIFNHVWYFTPYAVLVICEYYVDLVWSGVLLKVAEYERLNPACLDY